MKLAESCVIEQKTAWLLKGVEPTSLRLGTPDAAALIVRMVRGWANDMAVAPKMGQDVDVVLPIDLEILRYGFSLYMLGGSQGRMPAACSDLCGAMGALRHKVLAKM